MSQISSLLDNLSRISHTLSYSNDPNPQLQNECISLSSQIESIFIKRSFPKANSSTTDDEDIDRYSLILYNNWNSIYSPAQDTQIGLHTINTLYKLSSVSFHNISILRNIFMLSIVLQSYGSTVHALDTYTVIIEKHLQIHPVQVLTLQEIQLLDALAEGVRLHIRNNNYSKAVEVHAKLDTYLHTWNDLLQTLSDEAFMLVLSKVYEAKALFLTFSSHSSTSSSVDKGTTTSSSIDKPSLQAKAIETYKRSLSYANTPSTLFYLSFQYAETGQISEAITCVRDSLKFSPKNIGAWHLLVLLYTINKERNGIDYASAIQLVEAAFQSFNLSLFEFDAADSTDEVSKLTKADKAALIELGITYLYIILHRDGAQAAIESQELVFEVYAALYAAGGGGGINTHTNGYRNNNGYSNGYSNGQSNGYSNSQSNGYTNHSNGQVKGHDYELEMEHTHELSTTSTNTNIIDLKGEFKKMTLDHHNPIKSKFGSKRLKKQNSRRSGEHSILSSSIDEKEEYTNGRSDSMFRIHRPKFLPQVFQHSDFPEEKQHGQPFSSLNQHDPEIRDVRENESKSLINLWIASAKIYSKAGLHKEAQQSLLEARKINHLSPDVLAEGGRLQIQLGDHVAAMLAFETGLDIKNNHIQCTLGLCEALIKNFDSDGEDKVASLARAEGLLDSLTKDSGWNVPEAWFLLASALEKSDQCEKALACYWHCVELQKNQGVQPWSAITPRFS